MWWTVWSGRGFFWGSQESAVCSKFLGLQTFGSFKCFKLMGRVLKLSKIPSFFIKLSVREKGDPFSEISLLESSFNFGRIFPGCRFFISH